MMKYIFIVFSVLLFIYMMIPGPGSIKDFPALPNSAKSTLAGDTWQVPNVVAYYSNHYRDFVIPFYQQAYASKNLLPIPPYRLNYPPEYAYIAIKDQTQSTYLEELVYPLKGSLFVNGLEPFMEEDHSPRYEGANQFTEEKILWDTKTTLHYYPSSLVARFLVWLGIVLSILMIWKVGKKAIYE